MALGRLQTSIVENLVGLGKLDEKQLDEITSREGELTGDALDRLLAEDFGIEPQQLLVAKARAFGVAPFNVARVKVHRGTFEDVSLEFCQQHKVFPVSQIGEYVVVAFANPFELTVAGQIQEMTGKRVMPLLAREKDIKEKLSAGSGDHDEHFADVVEAVGVEFNGDAKEFDEGDLESEESAPIIQLANRIVEDAYKLGASDIHIEPGENELLIRYRIDGVCQSKLQLPTMVGPSLIARLKIMANLDISERRIPQDGRIVFKAFTKKNIDIDLRCATAPLNFGEGMVMRILDKQKSTLPLPALGFAKQNLDQYRDIIKQPYGMILHCGPTGSGKSMTLYSALNEINSPEVVIRTAEDPIEYTLPGINQMQMNRQIGLTFAKALRAFLRQDPDIILVGEIRDKETANIAVEAALTGHLLMSTLHTNDAPTTVARLTEMGIEPFMISSSLLCVCAQRLMRRVCRVCRRAYEPDGRERELLQTAIGWEGGQIYKANAKGCSRCNNTGYRGRIGIHELMINCDELVNAINTGLEASELKKIAMRNGMRTLHQDSMLKVVEGVSSVEEALLTVPPDMV